jgi:hypothetical protein
MKTKMMDFETPTKNREGFRRTETIKEIKKKIRNFNLSKKLKKKKQNFYKRNKNEIRNSKNED